VCAALGIKKYRTSLGLLDNDEKDWVHSMDSMGRDRETIAVAKSGPYTLTLKSRSPFGNLHPSIHQ